VPLMATPLPSTSAAARMPREGRISTSAITCFLN
jgi:hypothetical protein